MTNTADLGVRSRSVRDAVNALRALLKDPNDTAQGFRLLEALDPRVHHRELARMRTAPCGLELLRQRPNLLDALCDSAALEALPEGSLGRAYREYCIRERVDPTAFVEIGEAGSTADHLEDELVRYAAYRHRDSHDLWHVVCGYRTDLIGEAAILGFTLAQTRSPGFALLFFGGLLHALSVAVAIGPAQGASMWRLAWQGLQAGLRARALAPVPWEQWLARPLADLRAELNITEIPCYQPVYHPTLSA